MSKSDEFFVCTPIIIEIQRCENTYFSPKCCTTWETDTVFRRDHVWSKETVEIQAVNTLYHVCSIYGIPVYSIIIWNTRIYYE